MQSEALVRGWYLDETRENGTPLQTNDTRLAQGALGTNLQLDGVGTLTLHPYGETQRYHQSFSAFAATRSSETLTDRQTVPSQGVGGSAVLSRALKNHQTVVAGFDSHEEIGRSDDLLFSSRNPSADVSSGGRQRTVGVFGEGLIQITPRCLVAVNARFDPWRNFDASTLCSTTNPPCPQAKEVYEDRSDNAFSPRLSLVHQINSHVSWSASIDRAFRAPTLNELYPSFRQGNVLTQSNARWTPEQLTGGEAGIDVNGFSRRLEVRGISFFNEIIDPVANVTRSSTPTLITRQRQNLGRVRAPGVEIDAVAHLTSHFRMSGGYQFVDATVVSFLTHTALVGLWVPRNVLAFQSRYSDPSRGTVSVEERMVGKQYDDDQNKFPLGRFFVLDATASHAVGGVDLFAAAENLFNAKDSTAATPVPQLGWPVAARFGLRFQFPREKATSGTQPNRRAVASGANDGR